MPPLSLPFIEIAGVVYTLKYSLLAQFHLDVLDVDVNKLFAVLSPRLADGTLDPNPPVKPGRLAAWLTLFAACTAHNFVELKMPIRSRDEWAAIIPDEQWGDCFKAVIEALRKAPAATAPAQAPQAETASQATN